MTAIDDYSQSVCGGKPRQVRSTVGGGGRSTVRARTAAAAGEVGRLPDGRPRHRDEKRSPFV